MSQKIHWLRELDMMQPRKYMKIDTTLANNENKSLLFLENALQTLITLPDGKMAHDK